MKNIIYRRADNGGVEVGIYFKTEEHKEKLRAYPSRQNNRKRLLLSQTFGSHEEAQQYADYLHSLKTEEITAQAV